MLKPYMRILGAMMRIGIVILFSILIVACVEVDGEVEVTASEDLERILNRQRCFLDEFMFCNCAEPGTEMEKLFCEVNCEKIEPFFPEMTCPL